MKPFPDQAAHLTADQHEVVARASRAIAEHASACEIAQDVTTQAAIALRNSGYTRLTVPEPYGGLGATLTAFSQAQAELGKHDASLALILAMHGHVTGSAFQARTLPEPMLTTVAQASVRGELINALASEPELGSPSRGGLPLTTARHGSPTGAPWAITGRKTWSTGASALNWALVTATSPEGQVSRYWIDLKGPGITIEPTWVDALSLRGSGSHDVVFENAPAMFHAPGSVAHPAGSAWFWTAIAATYLGVGDAALNALVRYACVRVPTALGAPISTLPRVQERVGRIGADLLAARSLLERATLAWDADPSASRVPLIGAAKALATNAAVHATDLAVRIAGAGALSAALPLEKLLRDSRAGLTHPPSDETAYTHYGLSLLSDPSG